LLRCLKAKVSIYLYGQGAIVMARDCGIQEVAALIASKAFRFVGMMAGLKSHQEGFL